MIIQHRRGKKADWKKADELAAKLPLEKAQEKNLIPKDGEIFIIEDDNGSRLFKVGDGKSLSSALPYIDARAEKKLTNELYTAKADISSKIESLEKTQNSTINTKYRELSHQIIDKEKSLTEAFEQADQQVLEKTGQMIKDSFNDLQTEIRDIDDVTNNSLTALIEKVNKTETTLNADLKAIEKRLNKTFSDTSLSINELKTDISELDENLNKSISEESLKTSQQFNVQATALDKLSSDSTKLQSDLIELTEKITKVNNGVDRLLAKHINEIATLNQELENTNVALTAKIDTNQNVLTASLDSKAEELGTTFKTQLAETENTLKGLINDNDKAQAVALKTTKAALEGQIAAKESAQQKVIKDLEDRLSAEDQKLLESLNQLRQQSAIYKTVLSDQFDLLEKQFTDSENTWLNRWDTIKSTLNNISDRLSSRISTLESQYKTEMLNVNNELETLAKAQQEADSALMATLLDYITKIYAEIDDLVDDDILILGKAFSVEKTLSAKIATVEDTFTNSLTSTENKLLDVIDTTKQELSTEILKVDKSANDKIDGIVADLAEEITEVVQESDIKLDTAVKDLTKSINAVDRKLNQNSETLTKNLESTASILSENLRDVEVSVTENIENLRSSTNLKFVDTQKTFNDINTTIQKNQDSLIERINSVKATINNNQVRTAQVLTELDAQIQDTNEQLNETKDELATQKGRINNLIALDLPAGSLTAGDRELIDIRKSYDEYTIYESAGDAVRAIEKDLDELKENLPSYIPANAVDGLDYNEETNELYLMSKDKPVGDPVIIVGGGGGGSISTVTVTNKLPSNSLTIAKGNEAELRFTYTSLENGVPTGDGTYTVTINSKKIDALSGIIANGQEKSIKVADYLKTGSNTVKITCVDQYGVTRSLNYTISVIELKIESSFDSARIFEDEITFRYKIYGQVAKTVYILIDGEVFHKVDVKDSVTNSESTITIPKQSHGCHKITAYLSAKIGDNPVPISSNILTYEIICVDSESPNHNTAILASVSDITEITQGDLVSIPFMLYDEDATKYTVELSIYAKEPGTGELEKLDEYSTFVEADRSLQYWKTRKYPVGGIAVFKISYEYQDNGTTKVVEKPHEIKINALEVDVSPEEDSLQLYLSAHGRQNNEKDYTGLFDDNNNPLGPIKGRTSWTFTPNNGNTVTTTFSNFNWKSNGWVNDKSDGTGDTCLRLTGDARAVINFKPFSVDFKELGKTIEFEFAIRDVNNRATTVIDCYDADGRGFKVTPDTALFQSAGTAVSCRYKEEERVRVSITVEHKDKLSRFVSIYLDGILSGVQRYAADDSFEQKSALNITLGSSLCDIDIYSIRVYDKALSTAQILTNYIADKAEPSTKLALLTNNNVLNDQEDISYEKVKALGQIPIITFTGSMPTFKGDKKVVKMNFENPLDPDRSFEKVYGGAIDVEIDVQGTSSQFYARKNWKIKLKKKDKNTGKIVFNHAPYQHMKDQIPSQVFCIKVDYAEATGTHNTGTANYVETFYDKSTIKDSNGNISEYTGAGWLPPQKEDSRVRTTISGFPCVIFEKETEDSEPIFSSKANFNYDKDAEEAFGFTEDNDTECWEFCNNTSQSCNFTGEIPADWSTDFEPRYVPESANFNRIEDLLEAKKDAAESGGIFTEAQKTELEQLQASCIANFKVMHDWVVSTSTIELIYDEKGEKIVDTKPITPKAFEKPLDSLQKQGPDVINGQDYFYYVVNNRKLYEDDTTEETSYFYAIKDKASTIYTKYYMDNEAYRLAKFTDEFDKYFNKYYCGIYYVFTFFALMTDQRAKNMFMTRWKDEDGIYRWYPYFYDNDTIFGINNEGALVFDYYHEDIDKLGSSNIYNGQNSVLWNNFRRCFTTDIKSIYSTLRSEGKLTYDKIMEYYVTNGSDQWCAAIYNEDADYKYLSMAREVQTDGEYKGTVDDSNLYQVRGPGEHHLRYFVSNRLKYCDSKWNAGSYPDDFIFLRIYTPTTIIPSDTTLSEQELINQYGEKEVRIYKSLKSVPASPSIELTPFSNMYAGVKYKANGDLYQARVTRGTPHTFAPDPSKVETFNDTETAIYGASELSSLGDLSGLYCGVISLGKASKLTDLRLGNSNPDYHNDNFREVRVGANRLLKSVDLRNCSGLGEAHGASIDSGMVDSDQAVQAAAQTTLDLSGCPNIEKVYTEGTKLKSVSLPDSGYLKVLHLPATINTLNIKNQMHLKPKTGNTPETDGFSIESYANLRTLVIENCPQLRVTDMLNKCKDGDRYTVERVRLTGIEWSFDDTSYLESLYPKFDNDGNLIKGIRGLGSQNEPLDNAYLEGTCYIENLTGEEYAEIEAHYAPALEVGFGHLTSNVIFNYDTYDESIQETTSHTFTVNVQGYDSKKPACADPVYYGTEEVPENKIPVPFKANTDEFKYTFIGWSRNKGIIVEVGSTDQGVQADALLDITGNRILYPVFAAERKSYTVTFINPTAKADERLVHTIRVPYGFDAVDENGIGYDGIVVPVPEKEDVAQSGMYYFTGWLPGTDCITNDRTCYAQFTVDYEELGDGDENNDWYVLTLFDLADRMDAFGENIIKGYVFNTDDNTMSIANCSNKLNPAVFIPDSMSQDNTNHYRVTTVGGFSSYDALEIVRLPDTLKVLSSRAFEDCIKLHEILLPVGLTTIGAYALHGCTLLKSIVIPANVVSIGNAAFAECPSLTELVVDAKNPIFKVANGCLINTEEKSIIQALSTGIIPTDGSVNKLRDYCFAGTSIKTAIIPETITTISQFAFRNCTSLRELTLPSTLTSLGSSCFAGCSSLANVNLPNSLTSIMSSVFQNCAIEQLTIPASVNQINSTAFASLSKLKTVTFEERSDTLDNLKIELNAFENSGSTEETLHFYLPWTEAQHTQKWSLNFAWGAKNYELHFKEEA